MIQVKRALISVSDKTGLVEFAKGLSDLGIEIVSTGSTGLLLQENAIPVIQVSDVTGFPESLDGRVKTLHPKIHGGILADLRKDSHRQELSELGIRPFELVVVNLYPFSETVKSGAKFDEVVEQIDVGGPAMVRAAAKNHANVAIVVSPNRYSEVLSAIRAGGLDESLRKKLALEAFSHTSSYDAAIASWLSDGEAISLQFTRKANLRYGENSHQSASLYADSSSSGLASAIQLGGKEMSFNNFVDVEAALRAAHDFSEPAVAIIKHANPCGLAIASEASSDPILSAYQKAHQTDPVSAYGGVVATNRMVTKAMAEALSDVFTEVIASPDFEPAALEVLQKKKNLRILKIPSGYQLPSKEIRQISGGLLIQSPDSFENFDSSNWQLVSGQMADAETLRDLEFAWRAVRSVKSNAILLAKDGAAVGIGMGQVNRLDSCRLAVSRAGDRATGSVAASDAFFPFADGLEVLVSAGISAVVQPGGSVRDEEVIASAKAAGITMYFTGERHFFH